MIERCPEVLRRRFWLNVAFKGVKEENYSLIVAQLELLGFTKGVNNTFLFRTCDFIAALNIGRRICGYINKNNGRRNISFKITTQPLCIHCGSHLKFDERICPVCGSSRVEPVGIFDLRQCRIIFERGAEEVVE